MERLLDEALAGDGPTDEQLHEVRKAVKRVRYAAESVTDVFASKANALAERMEAAQELLGAHQDTVVIRTVLRHLAADATHAGEGMRSPTAASTPPRSSGPTTPPGSSWRRSTTDGAADHRGCTDR